MISRMKKRKYLLRLFSFIFSFFIWLYVISSAEVGIQKFIPLQLELPEGFSSISTINNEIMVKVKGPRVFVRKFNDSKEPFIISAKDYFEDDKMQYKININQLNLNLPFGVKLQEYSPKTLSFILDKKITKSVPIEIKFDPKIKEKFELGQATIRPQKIQISGAKKILRSIEKIETKLIEENRLLEGSSIQIELDKKFTQVSYEQDFAVVSYNLESKVSEFTFTQIPIIFQSEKLLNAVAPKMVNLKVSGLKSDLSLELKNKIKVLAVVPKTNEKKLTVKLAVELPPNIALVSLEPSEVAVITE